MPEYYNKIIEALQAKAQQAVKNRMAISFEADMEAVEQWRIREARIASWNYEDGYEDGMLEAIDIIDTIICESNFKNERLLKKLKSINDSLREARLCIELMQSDIGLMKEALED